MANEPDAADVKPVDVGMLLEPDHYLQALVQLVNGKEIEFPITVFLKGTVVTGQLVSGHRFFDGLAGALKIYFDHDTSEDTAEAIDFLTSPKQNYTKEPEEGVARIPPLYFHLRDARVITAGQKGYPDEGAWWRGRLTSVDGFHFGTLRVTPNA